MSHELADKHSTHEATGVSQFAQTSATVLETSCYVGCFIPVESCSNLLGFFYVDQSKVSSE